MSATPIRLHPIHERPKAGQRLVVMMKDGKQLDNCHATHIVSDKIDAIVIYHKRRSVDESLVKGWWAA